ncbi:MAG TPA: AzlD domain-containing protein [Jiangellales bacterium]|nr:AzlD domain-containing protein [Jiangellales bacterium]
MIWAAVVAGSVGCYLLKLGGLSLPSGLLERPAVRSVAALLPVALLSSLVAVGTFDGSGALAVDARLGGLAAAVVALLLRAPFVVVLVVATATTGVLRALA